MLAQYDQHGPNSNRLGTLPRGGGGKLAQRPPRSASWLGKGKEMDGKAMKQEGGERERGGEERDKERNNRQQGVSLLILNIDVMFTDMTRI